MLLLLSLKMLCLLILVKYLSPQLWFFTIEKQVKEKKQRGRKKIPAPLVDTSLRRCTRSAAKLDGFKHVVFEQLSLQPTKKQPRSKPMEAKAQPNSKDAHSQDKQADVPPHTPIKVL